MCTQRNLFQTVDFIIIVHDVYIARNKYQQKVMRSERASQEEQNGANFSSVEISSGEL